MPLIDGLICANGSLVKDDTIYEVSLFYIKLEHKKTCSKAGFNIWSKMYYRKMVGLERLETSLQVNHCSDTISNTLLYIGFI